MDVANILKSPWETLLQLFILEQYFICTFVAENLLLPSKPENSRN